MISKCTEGEEKGVLFCGDLLWIISVTKTKPLIGRFSFGWFLIVILKCISLRNRRAKEFKVLKCFENIFVLFVLEKCVIQSILVEANLHLAVKLPPDLIIRAIL